MIERLGKGEVTYKEVRDVLREEKKALSAVSKQVLGFKTGPGSASATSPPSSRIFRKHRKANEPQHRGCALAIGQSSRRLPGSADPCVEWRLSPGLNLHRRIGDQARRFVISD